MTQESAEEIEDSAIGARRRSVVVGMKTGEGIGYEAKDAEIKRLEEKTMKLEEEIIKLLEALEKGASGSGSNGVNSPTKLRQTVLA